MNQKIKSNSSVKLFLYSIITTIFTICFIPSSLAKLKTSEDMNTKPITEKQIEIVVGDKSPTLNGMGYIYLNISPLGRDFIANEAFPTKTVFEIGSGYNNIPIEFLKKGIKQYVANDLSQEHLEILENRIKQTFGNEAENKLKHLKLLQAKAPAELPDENNVYDAILIDKVLHFMSPEEIKECIGWVKKALKDGGKVYVTTASPYSKTYHKILPKYLKEKSQGNLFPGYVKNIMDKIDHKVMQNYPKYKVPNEMILFSRTDLVELFEREGMRIIKSYSFQIPNEKEKLWKEVPDDESNLVGIIAEKQ